MPICVDTEEGLFFFAFRPKPYVEFVLLILPLSNILFRMILPCLIYGMIKVPSTFLPFKVLVTFCDNY